MLVITSGGKRCWQMWRIGRRRLAWRPRFPVWAAEIGDIGLDCLTVLMFIIGSAAIAASWTLALLATAVVWPYRTLTGHWLVVAYQVGENTHAKRQRVASRAEADLLVAQWKATIESAGRL